MGEEVCRDYMNKICTRGHRCRFYHPPIDDSFTDDTGGISFATMSDKDRKIEHIFCHDYQNSSTGCGRPNCRYLHCAKRSSEEYQRTGRVNLDMAKALVAANTSLSEVAGKQLCKEYISNRCNRGHSCRFWHIHPITEQDKRLGVGRSAAANAGVYDEPGSESYYSRVPYVEDQGFNFQGKRPYYESRSYYDYDPAYNGKRIKYDEFSMAPANYPMGTVYTNETQLPQDLGQVSGQSYEDPLLATENAQLKTTYDTLLKTVNALKANNKQLLEENSSLRMATINSMTNDLVNVNPMNIETTELDVSLSSVFSALC